MPTAELKADHVDKTTQTPQDPENAPCIIVTYASVGSGHRSAAKAIAAALERIKQDDVILPPDTRIELIDILDYGYVSFDGEKTTNLFVGPTRPLYDIAWHYAFTGRLLWGGGSVWSHLMFKPFTQHVERVKPLAIIATHIVAANAAISAKMLTGQDFPVTIVPTDYGFEGLWPCAAPDLFCAADDLMVEELIPRKIDRNKICVTGIPVREGFNEKYDREEVLKDFGLPTDKMIVVVMAGANWRQPYVLFRQAIGEIFDDLRSLDTMHFVFVTGTDQEYAQELKNRIYALGINNITVTGFVENMPALMSAADLAIAKSGGLTVTECICAQLPLLLVGTSYGQERANTETVTREGAAQQVIRPVDLIRELRKINKNHGIVTLMKENGKNLRRPDAALRVAYETLFLIGQTEPLKPRFLDFRWGKKPVRER